jgi:hypothetical protein
MQYEKKKYARPTSMHQYVCLRFRSVSAIAASILTFAALTAGTATATTECYNFSSLASGSAYVVGDTVNAANATIELTRFQWDDGIWTDEGIATVVPSTNAGGTAPHELNLNNIMVRVIPDIAGTRARYRYVDFGGNVNFGVNGDFRNVGNLIELDGTVVGGCDISVTEVGVLGGVLGTVVITPQAGVTIERFGVGGQEFYIDDVCHHW